MGCTSSSISIDDELLHDLSQQKRIIKVLLLGSGESGKSTIFKQMKILHLKGFTPEERNHYSTLVRLNTIESMQSLCEACQILGIDMNEDSIIRGERVCKLIDTTEIFKETYTATDVKNDIKALTEDVGIHQAFKRQNEFHLLDSAQYLFDNIDRIFDPNFVPNNQDILRSRIATTGIVETSFKLDGLEFKMFDVGGQRGERKKWIHCFDGATAILFIAALSEYDQVLAEDRTRNRLVESLDVFEGIMSLPWFKSTPIILFLNKRDIFERKIQEVDIGVYFNNYTGEEHNYDSGLAFIQDSYLERNNNENKNVYCHVTDATNTENIDFVWKATKHILLEQNLLKSGLMML